MSEVRIARFTAGTPLREAHRFLDDVCALVSEQLPGLEWAIDEEDPACVAFVHAGLAILATLPSGEPEAMDADELAAALNGHLARNGRAERVWRTSEADVESLLFTPDPPEGAWEVAPNGVAPGAEAATGTVDGAGLTLDAPFPIGVFRLPPGARIVEEGGRAAFYTDHLASPHGALTAVQGVLGSSFVARFAADGTCAGLPVGAGDWVELTPAGELVSLLRLGVGVPGGEAWIWDGARWTLLPPEDEGLVAEALRDL